MPLTVPPSPHAADVELARACARGDVAAIGRLQAEHGPAVGAALRHHGVPAHVVDEVLAEVWTGLLLGDAARAPRIAGYVGRGSLRAWLRTIAVRTALRHLRARGAHAGDDDLLASVADARPDPELALLRARYQPEVRAALAAALARVPRRVRTLLRQHHLDGLSIDRLAPLHRVHRATVARWLAHAHEQLLADVHTGLRARLGPCLGDDELDSLVRLVRSQVGSDLAAALRP
jgi:RNA polymerase sigma-70 factor (ECF subfamily)